MSVQDDQAPLRFAREKLGPGSEELLAHPAVQVRIDSRLRHGIRPEDAVLAEVHRAAAKDRRIADEFVAYFLNDLLKAGHRLRSAELQRYLDTGDLVQSVLSDVWPDILSARFETRGQFLNYLSQRLKWKASDRSRALKRDRRREDRRVDEPFEDLNLAIDAPSVSRAVVGKEEWERLVVRIARLPDRDRVLVSHFLRGSSVGEVAAELDLTQAAARKALQRALRKVRELP